MRPVDEMRSLYSGHLYPEEMIIGLPYVFLSRYRESRNSGCISFLPQQRQQNSIDLKYGSYFVQLCITPVFAFRSCAYDCLDTKGKSRENGKTYQPP